MGLVVGLQAPQQRERGMDAGGFRSVGPGRNEDRGTFMAADASNGKPLWQFQTNSVWKASPMTYMFDNKQYVVIAAGQAILAFALPE